jgi:hypothetical protein
MVLIAKWLLEHDPEARILIITDRDELDKQIEGVMRNAGVVGADSLRPASPPGQSSSKNWEPRRPGCCVRSFTSSSPTSRVLRRPFMAASTCLSTSVTGPRVAT